ncbi:TPA: glycosyl transferase family 1, partial [Candidatus Bathyarchaeota archaeon]|nr:glycosyl transferase family 1 [Candidatus Bathyarchaeota archaeon]
MSIRLENYEDIIGESEIENIKSVAEPLRGSSVIHVNSTAFGGGVAEILRRMVPLMNDVGLGAYWRVIKGDQDFFTVTKAMHNGLQGMDVTLSNRDRQVYLRCNKMNAETLDLDADYVVIHDQQPLALIRYYRRKAGSRWIYRCHIDLSTPCRHVWDFVLPFAERYDAAIFTMKRYLKEDLHVRKKVIIPPSIDPLSEKNKPLPDDQILSILGRYDVDPERPIITQVGRFDP